jgi:hypothetical protein
MATQTALKNNEMKVKLLVFIMSLVLAIGVPVEAQITDVSAAGTFEQYTKAEFDILLKTNWQDPYNSSNVALDMELTAPSGKKLKLPCFYVSGASGSESKWKARFMAQETGTYRYKFILTNNEQSMDETDPASFKSVKSDKKGILRPNDYWTFKYDNGKPFRGIGENIGWDPRSYDNQKYSYEYMLKILGDNGGNFFRCWMNSNTLPVDWKTTRNPKRYQNSKSRFNESGIRRMEQLVNMCDSLGIHMMLCMETHGAFLASGWDINPYNIKEGGPAKTPYDFFTLDEAKKMYREKLRFLVARWGYSPAIGVWEFFNEIDNAMFGTSQYKPDPPLPHKVITDWHREMSDYLRSIDLFGHLISTSISHRDVEGMNDLPSMDFNQKHIYGGTGNVNKTIKTYIARHNKPYVIGEFSFEWDWNKDFEKIAADMISDWKRGLWYGLFSPTPVLPMSWWWEYFDEKGLKPYFKNVREIHDLMLEKGSGSFEEWQIGSSSGDLRIFSVKCGKTCFLYAFNPTGSIVKASFNIKNYGLKKPHTLLFNCEDALKTNLGNQKASQDEIILNDITINPKMDIILIINP